MPLSLRVGTWSLQGPRTDNEDAVGVAELPDVTVCVIADGTRGGAARPAVDSLLREVAKPARDSAGCLGIEEAIRRAFQCAHEAVLAISQLSRDIGSTADLLLWLRGAEVLHLGHIGDSRTYRVTDRGLELLTEDHDVRNALIVAGTITREDAMRSPWRNVLFRFLGAAEHEPDLRVLPVAPGDRVLLCTDGLSSLVPEAEVGSGLVRDASEKR
jgi:protein phosphatase